MKKIRLVLLGGFFVLRIGDASAQSADAGAPQQCHVVCAPCAESGPNGTCRTHAHPQCHLVCQ